MTVLANVFDEDGRNFIDKFDRMRYVRRNVVNGFCLRFTRNEPKPGGERLELNYITDNFSNWYVYILDSSQYELDHGIWHYILDDIYYTATGMRGAYGVARLA